MADRILVSYAESFSARDLSNVIGLSFSGEFREFVTALCGRNGFWACEAGREPRATYGPYGTVEARDRGPRTGSLTI